MRWKPGMERLRTTALSYFRTFVPSYSGTYPATAGRVPPHTVPGGEREGRHRRLDSSALIMRASSTFRTLPLPVRGKLSRKRTRSGTL